MALVKQLVKVLRGVEVLWLIEVFRLLEVLRRVGVPWLGIMLLMPSGLLLFNIWLIAESRQVLETDGTIFRLVALFFFVAIFRLLRRGWVG